MNTTALLAVIALWYALCSAASFVQYGLDKRAARRRTRRVPESRLLLIDLLGGWPGALLAQQLFRHKSAKAGYRVKFAAAIATNVATIAFLARRIL